MAALQDRVGLAGAVTLALHAYDVSRDIVWNTVVEEATAVSAPVISLGAAHMVEAAEKEYLIANGAAAAFAVLAIAGSISWIRDIRAQPPPEAPPSPAASPANP